MKRNVLRVTRIKRRAALAIVVASIFAICVPMVVAFNEADYRAVEFEKERALLIAKDVLYRTDATVDQISVGIAALKPYADSPCGDESLNAMRRIDLASSYIQAVAHVLDNRIVCSSLGREVAGISLGVPNSYSPRGTSQWTDVKPDFADDLSFLVIEDSGYAFIVHKDLPIDSSTYVDNVALAIAVLSERERGRSDFSWSYLTSRGDLKPQWLPLLESADRERVFIEDNRVVALIKSSKYFVAAVAVVPSEQVAYQVRQLAYWLVPVGLLSGVLIALALLFALQSYVRLLEREQLAREKAELQLQVQQRQKMETIGRVAGGIAHDFNNFLAIILGYLDFLREETSAGSALRRYSDNATDPALKAKDVIGTLLNFSRPTLGERRVVRADDLVQDISTLIQGVLPKRCSLAVDLRARRHMIAADQTQISQVIMNFVVNACDAYGDSGGEVILRLRQGQVGKWPAEFSQWPAFTAGNPLDEDDVISIEVEDHASGIAPEILSKLFEPFFSTKQPGKGTGLGLSIVYAVMQAHGGRLEVRSQLGAGTIFRLSLPVVDVA